MPVTPATYASVAADGFEALATQYQEVSFAGNIWFGGNTLHTCLDYLIWSHQPKDSKGIVEFGVGLFNSLKDPDIWWKDDYGWWGNAFMMAIDARSQLGYADSVFKDLQAAVQVCWQRFNGNWREKYSYNEYVPPVNTRDNAVAAEPTIFGGVFNTTPDSTLPPMSGRNSVTNELFWKFVQRLAVYSPGDQNYKARLVGATNWFTKWLDPQKGRKILNSMNLVLERPTGNHKAPAWYWSGDQGLMIEALPPNHPDRDQIALAVIANMADGHDVLHENLSVIAKGEPLYEFLADYATGKGIFMRNLARLAVANRPGMPGPYFDFIKANAKAVWCHRLPGDQFTFNWDLAPGYEPDKLRMDPPYNRDKSDALCDLIMQASGQDALNAAMLIARAEEIQC